MASADPPRPYEMRIAVLDTDEQNGRRLAGLFAEGLDTDDVAVSLVDNGQGCWRVILYLMSAADETAARDVAATAGIEPSKLRVERVAAKNWVAEGLAGLKPVAAGRFMVHGAHDRGSVAFNRIGIEIEAALAFGTGHHGTTRGCLMVLDALCKRLSKRGVPVHRLRVLDLGTGSGVLAIAAARVLRTHVLAADIDPAAVQAARGNARLNRVGPWVEIVQANGVNAPAIRAPAPFALVFANILLEPLQRLAAPLTKIIAPGGRLVLSGLLTAQANAARAAYNAFTVERRVDLDGWTTLVLRRSMHSCRSGGLKTRRYKAPRRAVARRKRRT